MNNTFITIILIIIAWIIAVSFFLILFNFKKMTDTQYELENQYKSENQERGI
jgi:hypothetical protein